MNNTIGLMIRAELTVALGLLALTAYTGEPEPLVARKDFDVSPDWSLAKTCGKDFWYLRTPSLGIEYSARNDGYDFLLKDNLPNQAHWQTTDLFKDSGYAYIETILKDLSFRLCVREIELFEKADGPNIAPEAKPFGECSEGKIMQIKAVNDTNDSSFAYSSAMEHLPLSGALGLEFPSSRKLSRAIISFGVHEEEARYAFIPDHLVLQAEDNGTWKDIPGTEKKDNRLPRVELNFASIAVRKIRLLIFSGADSKGHIFSDYLPAGKPFYTVEGLRLGTFVCETEKERKIADQKNEKLFAVHDFTKDERWIGGMTGEWDNEFFNIAFMPGSFGVKAKCDPELLARMMKEIPTPANSQEVIDTLHKVFDAMNKRAHGKLFGLNCMEPIDHLGLEWGGALACIELYGLPTSAEWQIAFARGAARQYRKPWMSYLTWYLGYGNRSYWAKGKEISGAHNADVTDWVNFDGDWPSGHCVGMSVLLNKRFLYLSYLCGMNFLQLEQTPFYHDMECTGTLHISEPGKMTFEWYDFVKRHPDRGMLYTPIAVLLDFKNGFSPYTDRFGEVTFTKFPYKNGDWMISRVTHDIFPHVQEGSIEQDDYLLTCAASERPYSNIFDVLLPNPPSGALKAERLRAYKVLYPLGDIKIDKKSAAELKAYVKSGGTLLLNSRQMTPDFDSTFLGLNLTGEKMSGRKIRYLAEDREISCPEFEFAVAKPTTAKVIADDGSGHPLATVNQYEKGKVIFTAPDYLLDNNKKLLPLAQYLLARITRESLPLEVSGDIGYTINRNDKGWIVGLFNNKGVIKTMMEEEVIDKSKKSAVEIVVPWKAENVTDLRHDKKMTVKYEKGKTRIPVVVLPGEVEIIQIPWSS